MQSQLGHLQINIHKENLAFYKDLLSFLGWQVLYEGEGFCGMGDKNGVSLWFIGEVKPVDNDYDGPGVNHLAVSVAQQADVDAAVAYLAEHHVPALFETPRHRPDFSASPDETYYQVMFESPDRILWEVVYIGLKA